MKQGNNFNVMIILIVILLAPAAWSQDSENISLVGHWADGLCEAVDVVNDTAYFANGGNLQITDFSDPSNPVDLGAVVCPSQIKVIKVSGNYAYVGLWRGGLRIVDISDKHNPVIVGVHLGISFWQNWDSGVIDISGDGNLLYMVSSYQGFHIVDVSDPVNPVQAGCLSGYVGSFAICNNAGYAFIGVSGKIKIIDIANPAAPVEIGAIEDSAATYGILGRDLSIAGDILYVADSRKGLRVYDISVVTNPVEIGVLEMAAKRLSIQGEKAYCSSYEKMYFVDISTPSAPVFTDSCDTEWTSDFVFSGDRLYICGNHDGLDVIDVSNPGSVVYFDKYKPRGYSESVIIEGDYAYVANDGLYILDITDPADPTTIGYCKLSGFVKCIAVAGSYAYSPVSGWLRVIDISNPANPVLVDSTAIADDMGYNILHRNGYLFVSQNNAGLTILDISNPANPVDVATYNTGSSIRDVALKDNFAFIAAAKGGLKVVDISTPASPQPAGSIDLTGNYARLVSIDIQGGYAYVCHVYNDMILTIDI